MRPVFSPDAIETDGSRQGVTGSKSHLAKIRDLVALFPVRRGRGGSQRSAGVTQVPLCASPLQ